MKRSGQTKHQGQGHPSKGYADRTKNCIPWPKTTPVPTRRAPFSILETHIPQATRLPGIEDFAWDTSFELQ
jgi:hypothetical protein